MKNCEEDKGQKLLPQAWGLGWGDALMRREKISPHKRVWGVWCILFAQSPVFHCFIHPHHTVLSHPVPYPRVLSTSLSHCDWKC